MTWDVIDGVLVGIVDHEDAFNAQSAPAQYGVYPLAGFPKVENVSSRSSCG